MKYYEEPKKQVPITHEVDVLVVGAGPAGVCAAISAARMGAKTMLIEQQGAVGGIATVGLMQAVPRNLDAERRTERGGAKGQSHDYN